MDANVKLILAFLIGLVVGVLGATSTIFQDDPEVTATQSVVMEANPVAISDDNTDSDTTAADSAGTQAQTEPAPEVSGPVADTAEPASEAVAQAEESEPVEEVGGEEAAEQEELVADAAPETVSEEEAEDRYFCMLMESSGQCRCFDAETTAPVEVSAEECSAQLAEE